MGSTEVFLAIVVTGTAGILLLVAMMAWARTRNRRNAALSLAFFTMALKGAVMLWFLSALMIEIPLWIIVIDLVVVMFFYAALAIRGEPHAGRA